ncbi:hypothetical protein CPB97_005142 [Podila verticillata]|nr:hypothetical protein CPB97_005142 [Podila verticillata]
MGPLYDLLLAWVPKNKILFEKKVVSTHEDEDGITIQREDSTNYRGDILVVAYGDYSGMRQSLYSDLAKQNNLPTSDAAQINIDCLRDDASVLSLVIGQRSSYQSGSYTKQLNPHAADNKTFHNAEWSPEANETVLHDAINFKNPQGEIASLIERTPSEYVSHVILED